MFHGKLFGCGSTVLNDDCQCLNNYKKTENIQLKLELRQHRFFSGNSYNILYYNKISIDNIWENG
ncbi:hypothetical protein KsCSTR_38980 [Candidatus Kuenenia stuttgartiensis]|uniref:Uncharacterized protein n=1 Tax=Kuenenia stuttgartiensis TaxID=174633 RepID=Q1PUN2_KUEST|nr:hypothetical protein KsCSTR_38980 [Candidatus Kuenenia stuttgartiensis]CAJ70944.1 unknown protein [Candidatus Kuenenia stuttgartiensis]